MAAYEAMDTMTESRDDVGGYDDDVADVSDAGADVSDSVAAIDEEGSDVEEEGGVVIGEDAKTALKQVATEFVHCDMNIKSITKELKPIRSMKAEANEKLMAIMMQSRLNDIAFKDLHTRFQLVTRKVKQTLTRERLKEKCMLFDPANGAKLFEMLTTPAYEERVSLKCKKM